MQLSTSIPEDCLTLHRSTIFLVLICLGSVISFARQDHGSGGANNAVLPGERTVTNVVVIPQPAGLNIEIILGTNFVPQPVRLTAPDRLVFDFPGFEPRGARPRILVNRGPVQQVRVSLFQSNPPVTRVVVDSKEALNFDVKAERDTVVIEITFPSTTPTPAVSPQALTSPEQAHLSIAAAPHDHEQPIMAPIPRSRFTAYELQARARVLKLEDLPRLEDKAKSGDPEAETTLALAYHDAILLKRDDAEALRLLHSAAEQNFMAAQESLGIFAETGIGMPKPASDEALSWYEKAVQQGSLDAATNIALMYSGGIGVPKDTARAMTWFRKAAEGGDATAQYNLARMYVRGNGIPEDYKEFLHWASAAADQNVLPALVDLANFYTHPPDGSAADLARAMRYSEKAANLGDARAQTMLGNFFASGVQGKPDYEQAAKWYRKASDQGEANAQYALATMLERGSGVSADPSLAEHYYQLAAERGIAEAQFRLGEMLAAYKDSAQSRISAYKWLMLAQGSVKESGPIMSDLRKSMSGKEIADAEHEVDDWRAAHRIPAQ
jgi:TPR repeat protein